jgi:S-adenosylmethionine synthetase
MRSANLLYTSESVTEGHPDKVCDQISDAVLDWCLARTPTARVACEAAAKSDEGLDWVAVFGEVTPRPKDEEVRQIVREVLRGIGYTRSELGASDACEIDVHISGQSADIAMGVDDALEHRQGQGEMSDAEVEAVGAGDQGMMVGFACNETPQLMPLSIALAQDIARSLSIARKSGQLPYLRPDGKSQVTVQYAFGKPVRLDTVVVSTQHDPDVDQARIRQDVENAIIREVVPGALLDAQTRILVNPTGRFVIGGPLGDSGLTGRKIIVDTYGGVARHGGGAFSGKDPTKVDRTGAYAARYVAKNVVAAGLAERFEVQLAYAIGVARPISISVETYGTGQIPDEEIVKLIEAHFDLRPGAIIRDLRLRRPIFQPTAAYGHFGRTDIDAPWEGTEKAPALRAAAGIPLGRALVTA